MIRQNITRAGVALLILGAALASGSGPRAIPAHAQRLADGKVVTIHLSTAARVFDMSLTGSEVPSGWMTPGFDDSAWDHATYVNYNSPCDAGDALTFTYTFGRPYWGPQAFHTYLIRQTFMVPRARLYNDSELDYRTSAAQLVDTLHIPDLAINGQSLGSDRIADQVSISRYLHPGINVLTAVIGPRSLGIEYSKPPCSAFFDFMTLRLSGLLRPYPLVLTWQPVKNAARYDVQVWLVKPAPGEAITPVSEVNVATQTTGPSVTLNDAAMPSGTYQWRTAAVNAHGSLISRWTPAQTVTLN